VETDPVKILNKAIENAQPLLGIQTVPVGSVSYRVPCPINPKRMVFEVTSSLAKWNSVHYSSSSLQAIRWISKEAQDRDKSELKYSEKLAKVLIDTAEYTGRVIDKKHEHHRQCEQNRAYAHFRWTR
jgi:small subunit ribosomal protein S7